MSEYKTGSSTAAFIWKCYCRRQNDPGSFEQNTSALIQYVQSLYLYDFIFLKILCNKTCGVECEGCCLMFPNTIVTLVFVACLFRASVRNMMLAIVIFVLVISY